MGCVNCECKLAFSVRDVSKACTVCQLGWDGDDGMKVGPLDPDGDHVGISIALAMEM